TTRRRIDLSATAPGRVEGKICLVPHERPVINNPVPCPDRLPAVGTRVDDHTKTRPKSPELSKVRRSSGKAGVAGKGQSGRRIRDRAVEGEIPIVTEV